MTLSIDHQRRSNRLVLTQTTWPPPTGMYSITAHLLLLPPAGGSRRRDDPTACFLRFHICPMNSSLALTVLYTCVKFGMA